MSWLWRAQVTDDWCGGLDNVRVQFARPHGPTELEYLVGFEADGSRARPVFAVELQGAIPEFQGFLIPREAVQALAEQVKPGPSQGEVKRLEEALAHERDQVRRLTDQLTEVALERATQRPIVNRDWARPTVEPAKPTS